MTINLADNNPRISYSVAAGVTQSSFVVPFEFFDNEDLNVYVDTVLKTLTTDYTVTGGDGSTGTVTISVTGASGGSTVVITRSIDLERTTDFPVSGAFNIASLNTELDRLIAITSDIEDQVSRSIRLSDYDDDTGFVLDLPDVNTRKGKYLFFSATNGAPQVASIATIGALTVPIPIADGGTAATDIATARANLGTTEEAEVLALALS